MIRESQMVVINNVFSFFQTIKDQEDCWEFLHKNLTPGTTLILHPTIDEATSHLNLSFDPFEWIELCDTSKECNDFAGDDEEMFDDAAAMYKYIVRGSS
ncbi:unnamed protein product [Caenorhabditis auriculariae]|uniref:Uncharacterized protein n=1 Tax=Caenorhabditis auriculariae TaxID=2777116 RepID=A0A8S1HRG3_9PELO|nr:unnamed protein product [Caenorhabditis auriculariae]